MRKAVFASAFALAMVGPLSVSGHGIGFSSALAQEIVLTEGHIYRLKRALHLTPGQLRYWRPVESALRAAIRGQRDDGDEGQMQKITAKVKGFAVQAQALQRVASTAGPLIASLNENQKRDGMSVIRSLGVASMF